MKKVVGFVVFFAVLFAGIALGGNIYAFLDIPSFIMVAGLTAGLTLAGCNEEMGRKAILICIKRFGIYSGWLTLVVGLISYFAGMVKKFSFANLSLCMLGLLYGYLISIAAECFINADTK